MARKDRRRFLTGFVAASAATAITPPLARAQEEVAQNTRAPSALPPNAHVAAAETRPPGELAPNRIGGVPGSDFMVDVIKTLGIRYCPSNCASSYRGLHESMINYGGNKMPEFLTCMHEESAVAMGHGYFKVAGKPLMTLCHGTVGLQHAAMAIYNAWCDRVPMIVVGGNDLDASTRPPSVPTFHSAQDINALVRDFTKWDDTPVSLQHFAQSFVRAYKIAMTPPYEPVAISLDAGLQESTVPNNGESLYIPRYVPTAPPQGDSGAVREAARLLASAERPVIVVGGNDLDAAHRPPGVPTFHSAQDINALVRDFTKWDDTPVSLQHYAQSFVRAYKIAMTPPYGPVAISLDAGLQQEPIKNNGEKLYTPRYVASSPPQGDSGAVKEAARLLANAERPVIVVDRAARTENGIRLLVQLAELLQAPVVDQGGRMNFPKTHYLSRPPTVINNADVIIGMELSDYWGVVNAYTDNGEHGIGVNRSKIKPDTKLISISSAELITKANYQDFQRFQSVDVSMPADAEATLPALIEAVRSAIPNDRKDAIVKRGEAIKKAHAEGKERARQTATLAWDASPISTARMTMELWAQIKDLDWSFLGSDRQASNWASRLWPMEKHYHHLGGPGGYGVGYHLPASVGAALANRDLGRFSVSIQTDGDFMYAPGVLWTAARHKIPLLAVMHNNRGYHQEVMHVQRLSNFRNRVASLGNDMGPIGTSIQNPDIEYHKIAESMGWWAKGPIKDPAQLGPAIKEAVAVVKSGQPALLNVWTQPR